MFHKTYYLMEGRTDVTLTTYVNEHSSEFLAETKRPAVLVCPGGAYLTCSEGEGEPVAMAFNAMGYQAFVLRYSTYMGDRPGIPMPGDPLPVNENSLFPNSMLDIGRAMNLIVEHSEEWHVNTDMIALCGFSAGGHNCGMYCVSWKEYGFPRPAAAVLGYPLADYRWSAPASPMDDAMHIGVVGHTWLTEAEMDRMSVPAHLNADVPPMFLWNTSEDEMVPPKNTWLLAAALYEHGIPCEVHTFENGPHGLSTANECSSVMSGQVRSDVGTWVSLAHTWLQKRFSVNLPDKMPF